MKRYVTIVSAALGLAAFALLASSCGLESGNSHQMGPPGKQHSMSDESMPSRAN